MHTAIVDGDVSYPPTSGKRLRTLHLMLRLAKRHRITYIARCDAKSAEAGEARQYLGDHGIETLLVHHPLARKKGVTFAARLALNVMSPLPYSVASHHSVPMRRAVADYAARHGADVWQFEWLPYMNTLPTTASGRRLVIAHNVDTLIWQRYCETAKGTLKRLYLRQQWKKMERFEAANFPKADRVVAVSAEDAELIRRRFGNPRVEVVDNGIDREYFASVRGNRASNNILFLGALDWRPNQDAVDLLLARIFPLVRAQEPSALLHIVGRQPPEALRHRIEGLPGVKLHADVPDIRPFLGQCGVMAVPLRIGGGSRLKILEALACGLPVVSSTVGAEGLSLQAGRDFFRADTPEEMAAALVHAIRAPEMACAMAQQGRQLVLARYDWDVLADKLEQAWENCVPSGVHCS